MAVGGILLGLYADHFGRKRTPVLIVVAWLLQSLSVGGEFASASA